MLASFSKADNFIAAPYVVRCVVQERNMKFVDEASIVIAAGKGGDGCLSFRREKFIAKGGPDGGNGGCGGNVYALANTDLNTLVDFRFVRKYQANNGEQGKGRNCTGAQGADKIIKVPVGTTIIDEETREVIADMTAAGQKILLAKGGHNGIGNTCFKSSTNQAPRKTTNGKPGEVRVIRLELKVIADIGLLGLPNAGKSTFIRSVSEARPKIASYPFTTLVPNLGVVRVEAHRSFVIADIPGLIEGASDGAGLGFKFLKHLARCRIMLHLVDVAPFDQTNPADSAKKIITELKKFSPTLANRERWLVLNKVDLLPENQQESICNKIIEQLNWQGHVFKISAINRQGTTQLCQKIMSHIDELNQLSQEDPTFSEAQAEHFDTVNVEISQRTHMMAEQLRQKRTKSRNNLHYDENSGDAPEVFYAP